MKSEYQIGSRVDRMNNLQFIGALIVLATSSIQSAQTKPTTEIVANTKPAVVTAIALLAGNQLHLARAGTTWESRAAQIPSDFRASVIAIDGPLLPQGADDHIYRLCEAVFIRSPFHNRCKLGLSHWGFGLQLRRASTEAHAQFSQLLASPLERNKNVHYGGPIAEAFLMLSWPC